MSERNVCADEPREDLFYIHDKYYNVYRRDDPDAEYPETWLQCDLDDADLNSGEWFKDDYGTAEELGAIVDCLVYDLHQRFASFRNVRRERRVIMSGRHKDADILLENADCSVCLEDSDNSTVVVLLWRRQTQYCECCVKGVFNALMRRLPIKNKTKESLQ